MEKCGARLAGAEIPLFSAESGLSERLIIAEFSMDRWVKPGNWIDLR